jgi:hypothetical protein
VLTKRFIWVLMSNAFTIYWIFPRSLPVELAGLESVSIWQRLGSPWILLALAVLVSGVVAELLKSRFATWINLVYYSIAVIVACGGLLFEPAHEHILLGIIFYLVPMVGILIVDAILYRQELWLRRNR